MKTRQVMTVVQNRDRHPYVILGGGGYAIDNVPQCAPTL